MLALRLATLREVVSVYSSLGAGSVGLGFGFAKGAWFDCLSCAAKARARGYVTAHHGVVTAEMNACNLRHLPMPSSTKK